MMNSPCNIQIYAWAFPGSFFVHADVSQTIAQILDMPSSQGPLPISGV